jgi:hypothetical protein
VTLSDQPRDEKGQFATTGASEGLSAWASKKGEAESPAKVIAKAMEPDEVGVYLASGLWSGVDPMVIAQYRAADATGAYFKENLPRLDRVKDYTAQGNKDVNAYLRDPVAFRAEKVRIFTSQDGNKQADAVAERARLFSEDLKNAPKAPGPVLRGAKMPKEVVAKLQVGKVFEARGNLSSTSDKLTANGFSYTHNSGDAEGRRRAQFMLHITQKSGVFVGGVSSQPDEMETVIPHGTRFRIDKVEKESRPRFKGSKELVPLHHLYMTEIAP